MAREAIFIEEIRQAEPPRTEITKSTHADVIVDIFIQILRECFSNHPIYTYVSREDESGPDFDLTQIVITDKYTEDAIFLPTIAMAFNSADTHWIQFSQSPFNTVLKPQLNEDGSVKRDVNGKMVPSHFEYTGAFDSSATFQINASDTIEREELTNLLHVLIAENLRDELMVRGVFVKDVTVGGQTEIPYREDFIYQVPVTVQLYSEWKRMIPVGETLQFIGFDMNVVDPTEPQPEPEPVPDPEPIEIRNLDNEFFVIDDATGEPFVPILLLSATDTGAPVTLVFESFSSTWIVSDFWRKSLDQTMIPYENFVEELNVESQVKQYVQHAADAIVQAEALRGLSLSQGRTLFDGTKVINGSFIFTDGTVDLRGGSELDPVLFSTVVEPDNTVVFRSSETNTNRRILVAKDVVFDGYGIATSGKIFKREVNLSGMIVDTELSTTDTAFITGANLNTMTAVDLFMIMQFATQPFKYSLDAIITEIDKLLEELADMSIPILNRVGKITSITNIKQEVIDRSEQFTLQNSIGL